MTLDEILSSGKPYFGDFLIAGQGPYEDYLPHFHNLTDLVTSDEPLTILEVGSWAGGSLAVWDKATFGSSHFIVVEQWKPYLNDPGSECHQLIDQAARDGSIEKLFWHNMAVLGIDKRLRVCRGDSKQVLSILAGRPSIENGGGVDIAFIDADHRYAGAKGDIEAAMPLVRDGGILCGDDLQVQFHEIHGDMLILDHQRLLDANSPNGHLGDGRFYHPGVTQAVFELFGMLHTAGRLWAVQKVGTQWKPIVF